MRQRPNAAAAACAPSAASTRRQSSPTRSSGSASRVTDAGAPRMRFTVSVIAARRGSGARRRLKVLDDEPRRRPQAERVQRARAGRARVDRAPRERGHVEERGAAGFKLEPAQNIVEDVVGREAALQVAPRGTSAVVHPDRSAEPGFGLGGKQGGFRGVGDGALRGHRRRSVRWRIRGEEAAVEAALVRRRPSPSAAFGLPPPSAPALSLSLLAGCSG